MLSRLIWGSRTALGGAFAVVLISELIGVPLGIIAGYRGGWFDTAVMRVLDIMLAFPPLLLSLAIVAAFGPSLKNVVLSLGILYVPFIARVVRGVTLVQREMTYTEAAKAMGYPQPRIIFRHILPNCIGPVIVVSTLDLAYALLDLAALSFLGLGVQPPTPDWGAMLSEGQGVLLTAPHLSLAAGFMILIAVLGFNLLGDGLSDVLDPRQAKLMSKRLSSSSTICTRFRTSSLDPRLARCTSSGRRRRVCHRSRRGSGRRLDWWANLVPARA